MNTEYITRDIGCAAYLYVLGFDPKIKITDAKGWFIFPPDARNDADVYWDGKGLVEPAQLLSAVRLLKVRVSNINQ